MILHNREKLIKAIKEMSDIIIDFSQKKFVKKYHYNRLKIISEKFGYSEPSHFVCDYNNEFSIFGISFNGIYIKYNGDIV